MIIIISCKMLYFSRQPNAQSVYRKDHIFTVPHFTLDILGKTVHGLSTVCTLPFQLFHKIFLVSKCLCTSEECPINKSVSNRHLMQDFAYYNLSVWWNFNHMKVNMKFKSMCNFPIFPGNTSTHLGHEVIKPRCLNTSKYS